MNSLKEFKKKYQASKEKQVLRMSYILALHETI